MTWHSHGEDEDIGIDVVFTGHRLHVVDKWVRAIHEVTPPTLSSMPGATWSGDKGFPEVLQKIVLVGLSCSSASTVEVMNILGDLTEPRF